MIYSVEVYLLKKMMGKFMIQNYSKIKLRWAVESIRYLYTWEYTEVTIYVKPVNTCLPIQALKNV